jgi:hypothetical protein
LRSKRTEKQARFFGVNTIGVPLHYYGNTVIVQSMKVAAPCFLEDEDEEASKEKRDVSAADSRMLEDQPV